MNTDIDQTNPDTAQDNANAREDHKRQQRTNKHEALLRNTAIWSRKTDINGNPAPYEDGTLRFSVVTLVEPDYQPAKYRIPVPRAHIRSVTYDPKTGKVETNVDTELYALGVMGYDADAHKIMLASVSGKNGTTAVLAYSNTTGAVKRTIDKGALNGSICYYQKSTQNRIWNRLKYCAVRS